MIGVSMRTSRPARVAVEAFQRQLGTPPAELDRVVVDDGDRRVVDACRVEVAEGDDRRGPASLAQSGQQPDGRVDVGDEHRRRRIVEGEQGVDGRVDERRFVDRRVDEGLVVVDAGGGERLPVALDPLAPSCRSSRCRGRRCGDDPRAISRSMPRRTPPTSSATTASMSAPTAGRSRHTTGVPPATIAPRYDWSTAVGTTSSAMTRRSTIATTISDSRSERSRVEAERMKRSPPPITASTPCSTPVQNGSPTLAVTTPTIEVVPRVRRRRANWLGRKPSSSAARRTLATLSGRTLPSLLRARDTVLGDTPARPATSLTVGARRDGGVGGHRPLRGAIGRVAEASSSDHGRVGIAGHRVGDRGRGVGDAVADGGLQRPAALERHERRSEQGVAGADRVGDGDRGAGTNTSTSSIGRQRRAGRPRPWRTARRRPRARPRPATVPATTAPSRSSRSTASPPPAAGAMTRWRRAPARPRRGWG